MNTGSKVRVYKTAVRLILTYTVETRSETKEAKQKINTVEMKVRFTTSLRVYMHSILIYGNFNIPNIQWIPS